ncbi:MAG: V-type ATP synthase subunit I [Gemmataceae bacterium]
MAIVPLDKITVYGTLDQKETVIEGLQRLGCLHLVNLAKDQSEAPELISKEAREALRFLATCPHKRRAFKHRGEYNREELIQEALQIKEQRDTLTEQRDHLQKAISEIEPWGDFHVPAADELNGLHLWFYIITPNEIVDLEESDLIWSLVRQDAKSAYVVVVSAEEPEVRFKPLELDPRSLSDLQEQLEQVEEELDDLHWKRVTLTRWHKLLRNDLDKADDRAARLAAATETLDTNTVFALQGWVPQVATSDVQDFAEKQELAFTVEPPAQDDEPPTLLKNPERLTGGEACVTFYITPAYRTWDPSQIVFFSFSLFFAMIVADAGYGLIMAVIVLLLWRKLSLSRSGIRFRNLFLCIVSLTIVYGIVLGSYFGITPDKNSFLANLMVWINDKPLMADENRNLMMIISIIVGVVHLSLANVISAYSKRQSPQALGPLGWASMMVGGLLFGLGVMTSQEGLNMVGQIMLVLGIATVVLFSSARSIATLNPLTHLRRLIDGLLSITNLTNAFGDVLSYLRLFALGLASAQLSMTFNSLAGETRQIQGIGVFLALLILLVGHGINFLLALMSGVVHGLRLNCIEFFNWSLKDEGYPFQPFTKKSEAK